MSYLTFLPFSNYNLTPGLLLVLLLVALTEFQVFSEINDFVNVQIPNKTKILVKSWLFLDFILFLFLSISTLILLYIYSLCDVLNLLESQIFCFKLKANSQVWEQFVSLFSPVFVYAQILVNYSMSSHQHPSLWAFECLLLWFLYLVMFLQVTFWGVLVWLYLDQVAKLWCELQQPHNSIKLSVELRVYLKMTASRCSSNLSDFAGILCRQTFPSCGKNYLTFLFMPLLFEQPKNYLVLLPAAELRHCYANFPSQTCS